MLDRLIALFSVFLILLLPLQVKASETSGKVTSLTSGQKAPFSGILLDPLAASKMLTDSMYLKMELELSLRKEFEKNLAGKTLALDLLRAEHESFKKYHTEILKIKENQITILNQSLKEEMGSDHSHWWIFGGVAIGILLSLGVFYASVEISKQ